MAGSGWTLRTTALLFLFNAAATMNSSKVDTFHVSSGHLFVLTCPVARTHKNVSWSREGGAPLPPGVEARGGTLLFLPLKEEHNGSYICQRRDSPSGMAFQLLVSSGGCPSPDETKTIGRGLNDRLPCKQTEVFKLNTTTTVTWLKGCRALERQGAAVTVNARGLMRFHRVTDRDAGTYTCLVEVSLGGRSFTSARSIRLLVAETPLLTWPLVLGPQREVVTVKVGESAELNCTAYVGVHQSNETSIFWTVNGSFVEDEEGLAPSQGFSREGYDLYATSKLTISKVLPRFLDVPIICYVWSPVGRTDRLLMLREAEVPSLYAHLLLCLAASLALLAVTATFFYFRVDLVLVSREARRHLAKHHAPESKPYDAYVSALYPDHHQGAAEVAGFVLRWLPERLEGRSGYSLFIRGRDDCPGEAQHDVIAATLKKCRRLIIVLPAEGEMLGGARAAEEAGPLREDRELQCFEQRLGLHNALTTHDDLRVILVELDGPVDYSCLPESLRFIKRKQGALQWRTASNQMFPLAKKFLNGRFWKNLLYHMPSVPAGRNSDAEPFC